METLATIHSVLRWLVLAGLLAGGGWALIQAPRGVAFARAPFAVAVGLLDLQVLIGIVLYLGEQAWHFDPFIAYIHPAGMVAALVIAHAGAVRARRRAGTAAYRVVGAALLFALVVVVLTIPWAR